MAKSNFTIYMQENHKPLEVYPWAAFLCTLSIKPTICKEVGSEHSKNFIIRSARVQTRTVASLAANTQDHIMGEK